MQKNVEQLAAERILESGVRVKLPAPLFLRLFGKKQISVVLRSPYRGTLFCISRMSLKAGFDFSALEDGKLEEVHKLVVEHNGTMSRIVATALLRSKWLIKVFTRPVAHWLTWHTTNRKMAEIVVMLVMLCNPADFTNSIRLIQSLQITRPRNLSPKEQGSQEDEQPDSIAPGEQPGA